MYVVLSPQLLCTLCSNLPCIPVTGLNQFSALSLWEEPSLARSPSDCRPSLPRPSAPRTGCFSCGFLTAGTRPALFHQAWLAGPFALRDAPSSENVFCILGSNIWSQCQAVKSCKTSIHYFLNFKVERSTKMNRNYASRAKRPR